MSNKTHSQQSTQTHTAPSPTSRLGHKPRWLSVLALLGTLLTLAPTALAQAQPHVYVTGVDVYYDHNGWRQGIYQPAWIIADTPSVVLKIRDYVKVTRTDTGQSKTVKRKEDLFVPLLSVQQALNNPLKNPKMRDAELALIDDLSRSDRQLFYSPFEDAVGPRELIEEAGFALGKPQTWDIFFQRSIEAHRIMKRSPKAPKIFGFQPFFFPRSIDWGSEKWDWLNERSDLEFAWRTFRQYTALINENKIPYPHRFETHVLMFDQVGHHRGSPWPDIDEGVSADDRYIRSYPE